MGRADETQARILDAAMAEFSAYGVAGARVDRIARTAGCNKNLIYIYFENKEALFSTILNKHLLRVYEELAFDPGDLARYARRIFEFAMANPDLMRLMAWSALESSEASAVRATSREQKIDVLNEAIRDGRVGDGFPARFLLTAIMALATAWTAASPFGSSLDPEAVSDPEALGDCIGDAVSRLASQTGRRRRAHRAGSTHPSRP